MKSFVDNLNKRVKRSTLKLNIPTKNTLSRKKLLKKYKLKTLKQKVVKSTKRLENVVAKGDQYDVETHLNTLNGFRLLFKNILKEQRKLDSLMNNDKQMELDMIIREITDKLSTIETKDGILQRIKTESVKVYQKIQSMYKNIDSNTKLPNEHLIEYYYEIITKLLDLQNDRNIETKVLDIISLLAIELSFIFFNKDKIEKEELEDDLSAMFGQMKVSKNSLDDLLEGFGKMKF